MTRPATASAFRATMLGLAVLVGLLAPRARCQPPAVKPETASSPAAKAGKDGTRETKEESRSPVTAWIVGRAITVSGKEIADAVILVQDGRIKAIGPQSEVEIPTFATRKERRTLVVAPGFVNPASTAYCPTARMSVSGRSLRGSKSAKVQLDPTWKEAGEIARTGYTTLAVMATGGGVAGQGLLVKPVPSKDKQGQPAVDDVVREELALLNMGFEPSTSNKKFWKESLEKARKYLKDLEAWKKSGGKPASKAEKQKPAVKKPAKDSSGSKPEAKKEGGKEKPKGGPAKKPEKKTPKQDPAKSSSKKKAGKKPSEPRKDPNLMPLVDVLERRLPGVLGLPNAASFLHFEKTFEQEKAFRPALLMGLGGGFRFSRGGQSGTDAWRVVERLVELKVPVILPVGLSSAPNSNTVRVTPRELLDRGVPVALIPPRTRGGWKSFRFQLMQLERHGIPRSQILRAVTLTPAEILGIQDACGSLEKGKQADLLMFDGDPLSPTSNLALVLVAGEPVYELEEKKS